MQPPRTYRRGCRNIVVLDGLGGKRKLCRLCHIVRREAKELARRLLHEALVVVHRIGDEERPERQEIEEAGKDDRGGRGSDEGEHSYAGEAPGNDAGKDDSAVLEVEGKCRAGALGRTADLVGQHDRERLVAGHAVRDEARHEDAEERRRALRELPDLRADAAQKPRPIEDARVGRAHKDDRSDIHH